MPILRGRRERFARGLADGLSQAKAAREAGYRASSATSMGSKLAHLPQVVARVKELLKSRSLLTEHILVSEFAKRQSQEMQVSPVLDPDGKTRAILIYLPISTA